MRMTLAVAALVALAAGCVKEQYIPYTKVIDSPQHRELIKVIEAYRHAMERRDAPALLAMASPEYFEDSGTPSAQDDYGYDGLKRVLLDRLANVSQMRYSMQYMRVEVKDKVACIDVFIDGSFQLHTSQGDRWDRKMDPHRFELVHDGQRWLFRRGM